MQISLSGVKQHNVESDEENMETAPSEDFIDVTIPLQCLVKNAKLILQNSSKVNFV